MEEEGREYGIIDLCVLVVVILNSLIVESAMDIDTMDAWYGADQDDVDVMGGMEISEIGSSDSSLESSVESPF